MTEHLPECPRALHDCERCDRGCYCNELRAYEQRMLDAAREAVAAVEYRPTNPEKIIRSMALDAIDALRKEKP